MSPQVQTRKVKIRYTVVKIRLTSFDIEIIHYTDIWKSPRDIDLFNFYLQKDRT